MHYPHLFFQKIALREAEIHNSIQVDSTDVNDEQFGIFGKLLFNYSAFFVGNKAKPELGDWIFRVGHWVLSFKLIRMSSDKFGLFFHCTQSDFSGDERTDYDYGRRLRFTRYWIPIFIRHRRP